MQGVLVELAQLGAADQDAILQALSPAQARTLRDRLADHPDTGEIGFAAQVQALSAPGKSPSQAQSEDFEKLSRLDLDAMPGGVVAMLLLDSPQHELDRLTQGWSAERRHKVNTLLATLGQGELSQASAQLRVLLSDGRHDRVVASNVLASGAHAQVTPQRLPLLEIIVNRIRSWLPA
jgi:hypothetical protein